MNRLMIAATAGALSMGLGVLNPVAAAATTLRVNGIVTSVLALQNGKVVPTPQGIIHVGDGYFLQASFDLKKAELVSLSPPDPTVNIYYLPGTTVKMNLGTVITHPYFLRLPAA